MREITYSQAISEATLQVMEKHPEVFILGEGVNDPTGIFGTTREAFLKFGPNRVMDMPIAENGGVGVALGAAVMGMRPLVVFARVDFMLLPMDQIVNHAAKWSYMYGGKMTAPLVMRAIIGRGWGQGPQHSQSFYSLFAHVPGIKVVLPTTPRDAKGLLISSLEEKCPVVFIEHRWLHKEKGDVPEEYYKLLFGKARIAREGKDVTIVTISDAVLAAQKAADFLAKKNISAEIIDLVSIKPWDKEAVLASVKKTGALVVIDGDWPMCSMASEIISAVTEEDPRLLKVPARKLSLAEAPAPTSFALENFYYPGAKDIVSACVEILSRKMDGLEKIKYEIEEEIIKKFEGSF